jgi:AcrR family transcriptional regulator
MVDAAVGLICSKGATKTTLKEVGEIAGYSRGLASQRFGSKDKLFTFIVRSVGELWLEDLRRAVLDDVGIEAIEKALDAHFAFIVRDAPAIRAFYILWFKSIGPDEELKKVVANIHDRRRKDVEKWLRKAIFTGELSKGVDCKSAAQNFCAAIIGVVYQWLANPADKEQIKALHETLKLQTILSLRRNSVGSMR